MDRRAGSLELIFLSVDGTHPTAAAHAIIAQHAAATLAR